MYTEMKESWRSDLTVSVERKRKRPGGAEGASVAVVNADSDFIVELACMH